MTLVPRAAFAAALVIATVVRADVRTIDETWRDETRARDVPVRLYLDDAAGAPSPIILLSHGLGGTRGAMAYAAEAWAARGYVCVALQHAGSDDAIWRGASPGRRMEAIKSGMNADAYIARCRDVTFAIDELGRRNARDGVLRGRVDLDRVGLAGHSFGAQTVQAIIGQRPARPNVRLSLADPRVKAAVAFSPAYERDDPEAAFAEVKTPCFHFTGTEDEAPVGGATPAHRRVPFDAIAAGDQYLVVLAGGDHAVFGGAPGRSRPEYAAWHKLIVELSTKFWDAHLRSDGEAKMWLTTAAKNVVGAAGTFEAKSATTKPAR